MTPTRRDFATLAAAALCAPAPARAQAWPSRPLHWVVGTGVGGTADLAARVVAQKLAEDLGQPVLVDNKLGGGGELAVETVFNAPPDGLMMLNITSVNAVNQSLYDNLKVDFLRDIVPVAGVTRIPLTMLVNPGLPAKTLAEFIAYAKANPGKVNFASVGNGTPPHLSGELFKAMAGVAMTHVPYRAPPQALSDLIGGQVQVFFSSLPAADYIKTGKLRALATTGYARARDLPDTPTVAETLPGFESSSWFGLGLRKGTPDAIVQRLSAATDAALADAKVSSALLTLGGVLMPMKPAEFGRLIADETAKWGKVVRDANIKPD
jgi:tripartite-type tricarboxylate transporter receptor subunit TctC